MADLLFEIGTEELPPGSITSLTNQIKENIKNELNTSNILINDNEIKTFNTPRRIAIYIANLPTKQKEEILEVKGPSKQSAFDTNGKPTQAAVGFAKKYNLEPKDLIVKKINNVEYVFAVTKAGGKQISDLLSRILPTSIKQTTGEKFMKWGNTDEKFARPIRWILAILDSNVINFTYVGVQSSNCSWGHRFFSSNPITITSPNEYEKSLLENKVMVSFDNRVKKIQEESERILSNISRTIKTDLDLIHTIANITEYPIGILCSFNQNFCSLPRCILETVLKKHQKCFLVIEEDKTPSNQFITFTNGINTTKVENGNEKVVKARLSDAQFFYLEDLKRPFTYEERIGDLSKITFQKGLGSMEEKISRLIKLSEHIYSSLSNPDFKKEDLISAAKLCKLDLTTHMVFEMPELQGTIGAVYAKENKYNELICSGISEHYEQCPRSQIGSTIGIVDKLDNIIGLFMLGKIPSGSADPFALRRQAQGIIDCILSNSLNNLFNNINLTSIIDYFINKIAHENIKKKITDNSRSQIRSFLIDRLTSSMDIVFGYEKDLINAVCSVGDPLASINSTRDKIKSINEYYLHKKDKFVPFLISAKRLVRIVEPNTNGSIDMKSLTTEYEKQLLSRFDEIEKKQHKNYEDFLHELSTLTDIINTFFDKILVNDPDPKIKQARQSLLKKGKELFEKICDFNRIIERN